MLARELLGRHSVMRGDRGIWSCRDLGISGSRSVASSGGAVPQTAMNEKHTFSEHHGSPLSASKYPLKFKIFALLCSLLVLVAIDFGLNLLGLVPPDDPLVSHAKTYMEEFSPFVKTEDGFITIRPEWISHNEMYRAKRGRLAGRIFLYPGFHPCRIKRDKPPGTIRIFAFGGSTTFGLFVGKGNSFPGVIEKRLLEMLPDHNVEVINLGCPGLDSTRIRILIDAVTGLDPDLLLIYSGHNEMLQGDMSTQVGLNAYTVHSRLLCISAIYRWMNYGLSDFRKSQEHEIVRDEVSSLQAGNIPVYDPLELPPDQQRLPRKNLVEDAAANYSANIVEMASKAKKASVPILFILPISNLFHPPYVSAHEEAFAQHEEFESLLKSAWDAFRNGNLSNALPCLDRAIRLSPRYAMAWYMRGLLRISLGQEKGAFTDLQNACDLDVRTHRLTSQLQSAMIDAVEASGVTWIDLRPEFYKELSTAFSKKVFVDHCHPTEYGHRLIAEKALPYVAKRLKP